MKDFWADNSKLIGKLILNQFGATFLGIMVVTAASAAESSRNWLMLVVSCFATLFYLFLLYNVTWERGGQDRIKIDGGRAVRRPLTGLWVSLIANIPNFIIAAVIIISNPFKAEAAWAADMNVIGRSAALLWEGMYAGVVSYFAPHNPLIHLLYIFPAVFVCTVGYIIGLSNIRIMDIFKLKQPKK